MVPRRWAHMFRGRRGGALLALAALCALRVPLPRRSEHRAALPHVAPHALAAHLADFNNLRKVYPYISWWRVDSQWSNYTSWRYLVRFGCGLRCAGRGAVRAHDAPAAGARPAHGHAATEHRVTLQLAACRTLPLLPWPEFCEELEVEWTVESDGAGGARCAEAGRARGGALAAALGALAGAGARAPPEPGAHLRALLHAPV